MKDLEKQIEEAAKNFEEYEEGRFVFIKGAKSQAAKEYWQQGMYSEDEIYKLISEFRDEIYYKEDERLEFDPEYFNDWFNQNKKK